jgi:hypothetical protein
VLCTEVHAVSGVLSARVARRDGARRCTAVKRAAWLYHPASEHNEGPLRCWPKIKNGYAPKVVRERRPCHLYFDLEFVPAANPGVDGAAIVPTLLTLLEAALQ